MALGTMKYAEVSASSGVEILYNSEYVGKALTLDSTAFTSGICKAGTPMAADGKKATTTTDTSNAIGILLEDVEESRPVGTIVIGGYINTAKAQAHSGVTVDAPTKTALKNVVFM